MSGQFLYRNRWVNKQTFRANVYKDKEKKLANSYQEFMDLVGSGLWFESKELALDALQKVPEAEKELELLPSVEVQQELKEVEEKPQKKKKKKHHEKHK